MTHQQPWPQGDVSVARLHAAYRWTRPNRWTTRWLATCRLCGRYWYVPADFYEALESTGLLINHFRAHLTENSSAEPSA